MMKTNFKKILVILAFGFAIGLSAQVKISDDPATGGNVIESAILELESSNKGLLLPRVQLSATDLASPLASHVKGMLVYNLVAAGNGTTAVTSNTIYSNDGTKWLPQGNGSSSGGGGGSTSGGTAVFSNINCSSGASNGQLTVGTSASGVTKVIGITVTTGGTYNITATAANISYSGSGNVNVGDTGITLTANGTPSQSGLVNFTLSTTPNCTFPININNATAPSGVSFSCNGISITQTPAGQLINGNTYTGAVSVSYTGGTGQVYPAYSSTVNELTLSSPAGIYNGSSSRTYTMSGQFAGATNTTVEFTIPECTNKITFGDAIRAALASAGCASCPGYDNNPSNTWVGITQAEYEALYNGVNISGTQRSGTADVGTYSFADNSTSIIPSNITYGAYPDYPVPVNSYIVGFKMAFTGGGSVGGLKVKLASGTAAGSALTDYGTPVSATSTGTADRIKYFVIVRPSVTSGASVKYLSMYTGGLAAALQSAVFPSNVGGGIGDLSATGNNPGTRGPVLQTVYTPIKKW